MPAYANPEGGQVVGGSATIESSGKKLDVHQHTDRAVINWRSFDIQVDEHTQFHQPTSSAVVVNRVNSTDPSHIMGKLSANGNVVLFNPNVFFDRDSKVDVNGLIATTSDIDNKDFMAGKLNFNKPGNPNAAASGRKIVNSLVTNEGELKAPTIQQKGGKIIIGNASGDMVVKGVASTVLADLSYLRNTGRAYGVSCEVEGIELHSSDITSST